MKNFRKTIVLLMVIFCGFAMFSACSEDIPDIIPATHASSTASSQAEMYSNKTYYVGNDVPAGFYAIKCTKTNFCMEIVIFESKNDYKNFQNAEKYTIGEYTRAVEKYAWASFYVEENETVCVGLKSGNVILLDEGMCEFSHFDATSSAKIYSGIYIAGDDIEIGNYDFFCIEENLQVTIFQNAQKYRQYHQSERFTIGEEADAIKKYSLSSDFIYEDDSVSVHLEKGMILMIEGGVGERSIDRGPTIK